MAPSLQFRLPLDHVVRRRPDRPRALIGDVREADTFRYGLTFAFGHRDIQFGSAVRRVLDHRIERRAASGLTGRGSAVRSGVPAPKNAPRNENGADRRSAGPGRVVRTHDTVLAFQASHLLHVLPGELQSDAGAYPVVLLDQDEADMIESTTRDLMTKRDAADRYTLPLFSSSAVCPRAHDLCRRGLNARRRPHREH